MTYKIAKMAINNVSSLKINNDKIDLLLFRNRLDAAYPLISNIEAIHNPNEEHISRIKWIFKDRYAVMSDENEVEFVCDRKNNS